MNIEVKLGKETFRITTPDSFNVVVERKVIVDPTKSPSYDPRKYDGALREDWREPKYYSTLEKALESLLERAARHSEATNLSELIEELKEFKREIRRLMSLE